MQTKTNKKWRGNTLGIAMGITMLLLMLTGGAVATQFAYITNSASNNVSVIATGNDHVVTTINVGKNPEGIAVTPDGTKVYVANAASWNISVIDTLSNTVVGSINVCQPNAGIAVNPKGTSLYAMGGCGSGPSGQAVYVINTSSNTVTASIPINNINGWATPSGIVVSPDGKKVYVATVDQNAYGIIQIINTTNNAIIANVSLYPSKNPTGITITPDGKKVYIADRGDNANNWQNVSIIYTINNTVKTVTPPSTGWNEPYGIVSSPDGTKIYVSNYGLFSGQTFLSAINTATDIATNLVETDAFGKPNGIDVTPDGTRIYLAFFNTNIVKSFPLSSGGIGTINVGSWPIVFGKFISLVKTFTLNLNTNQSVYKPGQTVNLTVNVSNPSSRTLSANLTLALTWPTGTGINFAKYYYNNMTPGSKVVKYINLGIPNSIFVPDGNYSITGNLDVGYVTSYTNFTIKR